jgi:hypothetical protein
MELEMGVESVAIDITVICGGMYMVLIPAFLSIILVYGAVFAG